MSLSTLVKPVICLFAVVCVVQPATSQEANLEAVEVAAQAAANYAFQVKQCAELAGGIPDEVVEEVKSGLASTRQFYVGAEYLFDLHFFVQWNRVENGEINIDANGEICTPITEQLKYLARDLF